MLNAVKNGKAGHSISGMEVPWRELFKGSEDSLTASVFERLFYLEDDLFWKIIVKSTNDIRLPKKVEQVEEVEFWPHWNPEGTLNSGFIEPDAFVRTNEFDLIVETKKKGASQNEIQWENEIQAYKNTFPEGKECYLLAVEGTLPMHSPKILSVPIIKTSWQSILDAVSQVYRELQVYKELQVRNRLHSQGRVLKDIINAFEVHGYLSCVWFENLQDQKKIEYQLDKLMTTEIQPQQWIKKN